MLKIATLAAALTMAAAAANAGVIVNLSGGPLNPNAGNNSGTYSYNPVVLSLGAGSYTVGVVGIPGGGTYDGYSVYAASGSNNAYTDGNWSFSPACGTVQTQASSTRFNTASDARTYYGALAPLTFTLTATTNVAFYLDDTAFPYFADDSGGVSLSVNKVPEPASIALLAGGIAAVGMLRRRRARSAA